MEEESVESEAEEVMSEVHLGCPPGFSGPHLSRFTFSTPPGTYSLFLFCIHWNMQAL